MFRAQLLRQPERVSLGGIVGFLNGRLDSPPGGARIDFVGSASRPEYNGILTATYRVGPFGFQWQQRFMDETKLNINWEEGVDIDDDTLPFYSFCSLMLSYEGETSGGTGWSARLAVNNAFNKNPPIIRGYFDRIGSQTGGLNEFNKWARRYQLP